MASHISTIAWAVALQPGPMPCEQFEVGVLSGCPMLTAGISMPGAIVMGGSCCASARAREANSKAPLIIVLCDDYLVLL
jgi:hypothetical protein